MSFVETKMINSDFLQEPLNHLSYIDSIERNGEMSYMFDTDDISKKRLHDFLAKSSVAFTHTTDNMMMLFDSLTGDDWYYFFKGNDHAGEGLNSILGNNYFSNGNFDNICEYMNMTAIQAMTPDEDNPAILEGFGKVMGERLEASDALDWIKARFNVDLSSYANLSEVILSTDGWKTILKNNSLMSCACTSQWFTQKVVEARRLRIWRLSTQDYYDDNGTHYATDGSADGKNITSDALQLMKDNNLVTEDYLTLTDTAYARLKDALLWFAQNESITALKQCSNILSVFCADESCCKFLANNPALLTECLNDQSFASAIFNSTLARDTINASTDAKNAFNAFITAIQTANATLTNLGSALNTAVVSIGTAQETDGLKDSITPLMEEASKISVDIENYRSYISVMNNLINLMSATDEAFVANLLNDSSFVNWAVNDATFVNQMTHSEMMSRVLCANNGAWTAACNSTTYITSGLIKSDIALDAMLANETARNTAISTSTSMNTMTKNSRVTNSLISDAGCLAAIIDTPSALSIFVNSSLAMNVLIGNSTAWNTMLGSSVGMSAICGSGTAMDIMVNNEKCIQGMVNSDMVMGLVVNNDTAMNCILGSQLAMNEIVNSQTAINTTVNSIGMLYRIVNSQDASNIFIQNTSWFTSAAYNSTAIGYIANSSITMSIVTSSTTLMSIVCSSDIAKNSFLQSNNAMNYLDNSPLAQTVTTGFTLNNVKGFMISYTASSNYYSTRESGSSITYYEALAGYKITIDTYVDYYNRRNASGSSTIYREHKSSNNHIFFNQTLSVEQIVGSVSVHDVGTGKWHNDGKLYPKTSIKFISC